MDLDKLTLEEILELEHSENVRMLELLISVEGIEKTIEILADNGRI